MDISELPKKYDILEGIFRTNKDEMEFVAKLRPHHRRVYYFLYYFLIVGIIIWLLNLILIIFVRNALVVRLFIFVSATNILISIIRQRMRKSIKKRILTNQY